MYWCIGPRCALVLGPPPQGRFGTLRVASLLAWLGYCELGNEVSERVSSCALWSRNKHSKRSRGRQRGKEREALAPLLSRDQITKTFPLNQSIHSTGNALFDRGGQMSCQVYPSLSKVLLHSNNGRGGGGVGTMGKQPQRN